MRKDAVLWALQRASALVLAMCVLVHLATIAYAVQGGLSAGEILGRTRGSVAWMVFYTVFVLATAIHVPIGLRSVCAEWFAWRGAGRDAVLYGVAALQVALGMTAVLGVFV